MSKTKIALAGQPNCGKSTIFNMLSGARQHIANYPGVTVDKKTGFYSIGENKIELVDLPGTYSLTSFSLEERVAREFIIGEDPDIILNVLDSSNLKRNLYLTFQLMDMEKPLAVVLNMADIAKKRGIHIDKEKLSLKLGVKITESVGNNNEGKENINNLISETTEKKITPKPINYRELEPYINELKKELKQTSMSEDKYSIHWLAIKLLENDEQTKELIKKSSFYYDEIKFEDLMENVQKLREDFQVTYSVTTEQFIAGLRYDEATKIIQECSVSPKEKKETFSDKVDKIVLNRALAIPIMALIVYLLYELAIVQGYKVTDYTWPLLAGMKNFLVSYLPLPDYTHVPYLREFGIWMINSVNALLNYIPIFFILFALIAILEDVGYMPRMAFVLDRLFRRYGLHGQSTLPLVLGGVFAGGCAVPGIMSTKGIADPRARMATILTVPLMNCLAKIPFYTLIVSTFFKPDMALLMFFISTITVLFALSIAKILTLTVLKHQETAPFIMEMPPYHLPTIKGVLIRAFERIWLYIKKIVTIVAAVAVVLFVLIQFPGVSPEKQEYFNKKAEAGLTKFYKMTKKSSYSEMVDERTEVVALLNYYGSYRTKKMNTTTREGSKKLDESFKERNPQFFKFIKPKRDKEAKKINRALRKLTKVQKRVLREIKEEKVSTSLLGMAGKALEPITQFAGFDWKINVAFLSSFAARESSVATLGAIYENGSEESGRVEANMGETSGFTTLHAIAIIIFMALTPPCIATMIMIKVQTNSYGWMLFAIFYPITLGLTTSSIIFTLGTKFSIDGLSIIYIFYGLTLLFTIGIGFVKNKPISIKN